MEQLPPERSTAAKIITAELLKCLEQDPSFRGRRLQPWMYRIREWPGKVVPVNDDQVRAAVLTLISRTLWPYSELQELTREVKPLYEAGWCNDAIVRAMEYNPDDTRAVPWHAGTGDGKHRGVLAEFIQRRLRKWRQADPDSLASVKTHIPPTPIVRAVSFDVWAGRMRQVYGDGERDLPANPMTPEQIQAVHDRSHRWRGSPLDRNKRRIAQLDLANQRLEELGGVIPHDFNRDDHHFVDPTDDLILLSDPDVHRALCEFTTAERRDHHHASRLRAAITRARLNGAARNAVPVRMIAELSAAVTRPDGTPVAQKTLRYLLDKGR
ncbi:MULTISPECIES: hypothetical protein [Saccharothrix]|uniref:hypothetical protein n=1 Tax=Saccharothrix TaxID=2071 RepID=UPI00093CFA3D|nr:hypothetical protein [Saccharothrix sp. CB00851]OKI23147.1 hypothetical protein A6A25_35015 [Saccharothrix sp. CB00851]